MFDRNFSNLSRKLKSSRTHWPAPVFSNIGTACAREKIWWRKTPRHILNRKIMSMFLAHGVFVKLYQFSMSKLNLQAQHRYVVFPRTLLNCSLCMPLALPQMFSPLACIVFRYVWFQFASLHNWKEGCSFKRLHSGTWFQMFAVWFAPAHCCHVKERPNNNKRVLFDAKTCAI